MYSRRTSARRRVQVSTGAWAPSQAPTFSPRTPVRPRLRQPQASGTAAPAARLFLSMGRVFFDFSGGVGDHRRNLLGVRFVHGVAGALDFGWGAFCPPVVPTPRVRGGVL